MATWPAMEESEVERHLMVEVGGRNGSVWKCVENWRKLELLENWKS